MAAKTVAGGGPCCGRWRAVAETAAEEKGEELAETVDGIGDGIGVGVEDEQEDAIVLQVLVFALAVGADGCSSYLLL